MKNQKTLFKSVLVLIIIGIFMFVGCNNKNAKDKIKIAFVVPTLENPFFVDMTNAAEGEIKKHQNVELLIQAPQKVEQALKQNEIVENLIIQKVDAICIVPTNSESIIPIIKKANAANIPVINIDNKINMELAEKKGVKITTYIGSDNYEGGKLAGEFIILKLDSIGVVAILEGVSGNDAAIKRKAGFLDAIKDIPTIKVVATQAANWSREQAFNIFQNILQANPDLDALFACNDEMALGAVAAMEDNKMSSDKIVIVGFDATDEAIIAVKEGRLNATIAQQPKLMGKKAIELTMLVIDRKTIKLSYSTKLMIIDE